MATYCFSEQPRALYVEACMRGYVAAARTYPQVLGKDESWVVAQAIPGTLRGQVCCIALSETPYQRLVAHGWFQGYRALCNAWESQIAQMVLDLKPLPLDEAYRVARFGFCHEDMAEDIDAAYTRYLTFCRTPA